MIDLDAYFTRIGYTGPRTATLETLRAIHTCHTQAIPFENLSPLLGQPVELDSTALEQKLVHGGRGGYCFEHNSLLRQVLEALGFHVTGLAARVLWHAPEDSVPPHTHMLLRVDLGDEFYIVDVGFGGMTLTAPLRLAIDAAQATPHEDFRLVKAPEDSFRLQVQLPDGWRTLYQFDLQPQKSADYDMYNFYVSHHPESRFIHDLIVARPAPDRRYALNNSELTIHHLHGDSEKRRLESAAELHAALEEVFLLNLPRTPALDAQLMRIAKQAKPGQN